MKFAKTLLIISVTIFFVLLTIRTSTDFSQDLGRHLVLGKIISETKEIPRTNMFSYTYPDFPFINHHWLSEVIFYQVQNNMGLDALLVMRNLALYIALAVCIYTAYQQGAKKEWIAYTVLIIAMAYAHRTFIRPELFGFVFFALLVWYLVQLPERWQWYIAVPIILALWINLHLTFVFGVFVALLIVLKTKFDTRGRIVFFGLGALLLNPWGLEGVLYPLSLFNNYGYAIAENMPIHYMIGYSGSPWFWYLFVLVLLGFSFAVVAALKKKYPEAMLLAVVSMAALLQIRQSPFLCLASVALLPVLLPTYRVPAISMIGSAVMTLLVSSMILSGSFYSEFSMNGDFGWGFTSLHQGVIDKAKTTYLPGRIFNNFDDAGHVIYGLYPRKKVFVDNRPEAYPSSFFKDVYIPLQENEAMRKKVFKQYNIRTVIFTFSDQTEWSFSFLHSITKDTAWKLLYIDSSSVLLINDPTAVDIRKDIDWYKRVVNEAASERDLIRLGLFFINTDNTEAVSYTQKMIAERYQ
ncbi:MAG: hypothetical protein NUV52_03755 [Candidatus Roizmanbacteria bacterium]|nr:hypothetical protein [Candidatus Roizmanbacteria bacterium]